MKIVANTSTDQCNKKFLVEVTADELHYITGVGFRECVSAKIGDSFDLREAWYIVSAYARSIEQARTFSDKMRELADSSDAVLESAVKGIPIE